MLPTESDDAMPESSSNAARLIFDAHLPIARRIAAKFAARFPSLNLKDDIEAAALAALWRAALTHAANPRGNIEGYVVVVVNGACQDELTANDWLSRRTRKKHGADFTRVWLDAIDRPDSFLALSVRAEAESMLHRKELLERLRPAIAKLRKREQLILGKFISGMSWVEIATELAVTQPRISQIWSRIVGKLQCSLGLVPTRVLAARDWRALRKKK
jgi:RNA polymerase sigma factor (sigma-70 family)